MKWPGNDQVIRSPDFINPMESMPAEQLGRSIDTIPPSTPSNGGGGGSTDWPLKLIKVDDTHAKVTLGTVSGFTPTDVDTSIDVSGTDGVWAFYFHATIAGTAVTAVELLYVAGGSVPSDDGNNSYRLVGYVTVASGVITLVNNSFAWSQSVITCTADTAPHVWQTGA